MIQQDHNYCSSDIVIDELESTGANQFETPKKVFKRRHDEAICKNPLPTKNRYDLLHDHEPRSSNEDVAPSPVKIPPLFIQSEAIPNYQKIVTDIKSVVSNQFQTENKGKKIKISLTSIEDFRSLTSFYDKNNVQYYTFKISTDDNISVVIRNIACSITEEEILNELLSLNLPILKVVRLLKKDNTGNKIPIPLCFITLSNTDEAKKIFDLTHLFYMSVKVELRRKSRDIPQCQRCQRYGHTKNFCRLNPRCVKCTDHHHFSTCPKVQTDSPTCVNCGDSHPANYRGCPYFKTLKSKISGQRFNSQSSPIKNSQSIQPIPQPTSPTTPNQNSLNYANAVKSNKINKPINETHSTTAGDIENLDNLITPNFQSIISQIISPLISKLTDIIKKVFCELLSSLNGAC